MARIDVEIEDYLDEVSTKHLVRELQYRTDIERQDLSKLRINLKELFADEIDTPHQILKHIKSVLGLHEWDTKKEIIEAINEL